MKILQKAKTTNILNTKHKRTPSFHAKPGTRLIKTAQKEFNNDSEKINKFKKLFTDIFEKHLDSDTIIDINHKKNWIISHSELPNAKFCKKNTYKKDKPITQNLIEECTRTFAYGELQLFRIAISNLVKSGHSFEEIKKISEKITKPRNKKCFLEEIAVAERIKKENPSSKLSLTDFSYMSNKISNEDLQNPNSELWALIHSSLRLRQ